MKPMRIEQFVMAYGVEQDRVRALLPEGFESLRPVLRINSEIRNETEVYLELNASVEHAGCRGWLNIASWRSGTDELRFTRFGRTVRIEAPFLKLTYTGVGIEGGCPAERDNCGCFFRAGAGYTLRSAETVTANKEFCDCEFAWTFHPGDAHGVSIGKTLPAYREEIATQYEKQPLTAENAAAIPCRQVLGAYIVRFERCCEQYANEGNAEMKKVIVIGSPGAGKSTFARKLKDQTGLPLYYLDRIFHKPDRTTVTREEFDQKLQTILQTDRWIIDGNYRRTLPLRFEACTDVFFLDFPLRACLEGAASRVGTVREDMPWVEQELDPKFRQYILDFPKDQLPKIYELIEQYRDRRRIMIFHSREEADQWIASEQQL